MAEYGLFDDEDFQAIGRLVVNYGTAESFIWFLAHELGVDEELVETNDAPRIRRAVVRRLAAQGLVTDQVARAFKDLQAAKTVRDRASHSAYLLLRDEVGLRKLQRRPKTRANQAFDRQAVLDAGRQASDVLSVLLEATNAVIAHRARQSS